jgi:GNAT superfamily N-acetyltransferase
VSRCPKVDIRIHPAIPERWDDLTELFERPGPRGGTPFTAGCWCQYWHVRGKAYERGWGAPNRARLEEQVRGSVAPGLLAYAGETAVGWCRLGPRASFERLECSPNLARVDDEDVWSVVCFAVHPSWRRHGVAGALLEAAASHAVAQRARLLEAYPVHAGHHVIDSFTGYLPMFLAAAFEEAKDAGRRTIVRRRLG